MKTASNSSPLAACSVINTTAFRFNSDSFSLSSSLPESVASCTNPASVGLPGTVFVEITLHQEQQRDLEAFERAVRGVPEVMECYLMTGDADYLLRVVVASIDDYERFLVNELTTIPGVASIKSSFALKQVKYRTDLPLELS